MERERLLFGELIAAGGAVLLFIFMFVDWYGAKAKVSFNVPGGGNFPGVNAQSAEETFNAWDRISGFWILLLLVAIVAVIVVAVVGSVSALSDGRGTELSISPGRVALVAGALAFVVVLIKVIFTPDIGAPGSVPHVAGLHVDVDVSRKIGIFLALIASAGMAAGGYVALSERNRAGGQAPPRPGSAPPPSPGGQAGPQPPGGQPPAKPGAQYPGGPTPPVA